MSFSLNCLLVFILKATELADNGLPTEATVTAEFSVTILDQNDNSPVFLNTTYIVSVDEMGDVNSTIQIPGLQIEVDDPDEVSNSLFIPCSGFNVLGFLKTTTFLCSCI